MRQSSAPALTNPGPFGNWACPPVNWESVLPLVNIRMVAGVRDESKSRIAKSVAEAIAEETGVALKSVWVVFEDVRPEEWFVGENSVAEMRRSAS